MAASQARDEILDIRFNELKKTTEETLTHAKKTNGRVTQLEKDIAFLHWLKKNKWYIGVILLAFMKVYETVPFKKFYEFAIKLLTTWI